MIADKDAQGNPSGIFTYAAAAGDAGSILLSAPNVALSNGALSAPIRLETDRREKLT